MQFTVTVNSMDRLLFLIMEKGTKTGKGSVPINVNSTRNRLCIKHNHQ